jgi:hypothetical protein
MQTPNWDPEEWIVSFNDVKQLYFSVSKKLTKWAVLGASAALIYCGSMDVKYKAEASFKEGVEERHSENPFKELVAGISPPNKPQVTSVMKSYQVLKPLVEKMGLQIVFAEPSWTISKWIRRLKDHWKAEKGTPLSDIDSFVFSDVCYKGEIFLPIHIIFQDREQFSVYNKRKKNELAKGKVGQPVLIHNPPVQFTLKKLPKNLKKGCYYRFHIHDWRAIVASIRKKIKIKTDKDNQFIINISMANRDRHLAVQIINELMDQYQSYLKQDFESVAGAQLAYLESKQDQILNQMGLLFDQHTAYLANNLNENGTIGLEQQAQSLLIPHQRMQDKLISIDVELSRLDQIEKKDHAIGVAEEGPFAGGIHQILHRINELKQQRDLIELSLSQVSQETLKERRDELKEIRDHRFAVERLLQEVDHGVEISSLDFNQGLYRWAKGVHDPEEKEDLAQYLQNYSRLLSLKEKMLQEQFFYSNFTPTELQGIDLSSARNLFLEYNGKLDAAEALIRHYSEFRKEISNPNFELSSLSSVLKDPLCQKIILQASNLSVLLKDEKHHSSKENERWKEEISLYSKILADQLDQLSLVEELNVGLIRQKMTGLQKVSLDCINRLISVLNEQVWDAIKERRQTLSLEKDLLEKKIAAIRTSIAASFPEKWRFEKWLDVKTSMIRKILEAITEVVESKSLSNHLHFVESKPLDHAIDPIKPIPPGLFRMIAFGAFIFPFLVFSFILINQLLKGFPITLEKLKALDLPVLGPISPFCDGPAVGVPSGPDLDLIRNMTLFFEGAKVVGIIAGDGPDYSYVLGENLARRQDKSIVIRCDFMSKFRFEDTPGILQIWKSEIGELPIQRGKGFDYISTGGYTPFGTEIIQSQPFTKLLDLLKKKYDRVFLYFHAPLTSAESVAALHLCDKAVITVTGERIEELTPFINWGYDGDHCRLTFITRA